MHKKSYVFRADAPDEIGILAEVASALAGFGLNITESHDFADLETGRFFIWVRFAAPATFQKRDFHQPFEPIAKKRNLK